MHGHGRGVSVSAGVWLGKGGATKAPVPFRKSCGGCTARAYAWARVSTVLLCPAASALQMGMKLLRQCGMPIETRPNARDHTRKRVPYAGVPVTCKAWDQRTAQTPTCSYLLLPAPTCSYCSYLLLPAPTCSYLLLPAPTHPQFRQVENAEDGAADSCDEHLISVPVCMCRESGSKEPNAC